MDSNFPEIRSDSPKRTNHLARTRCEIPRSDDALFFFETCSSSFLPLFSREVSSNGMDLSGSTREMRRRDDILDQMPLWTTHVCVLVAGGWLCFRRAFLGCATQGNKCSFPPLCCCLCANAGKICWIGTFASCSVDRPAMPHIFN